MFDWKPEYSVEIPEVDAQHKKLFSLAAELHLARTQGKSKTVLEQALHRLVEYTKIHFAQEEELMQKWEYPDALAHKKQHDQLTEQVTEFEERFAWQDLGVSLDLMQFLKTWLERHIKVSDQKYAAHIRSLAA